MSLLKKPLSAPYYSILQLRLDFWKELKNLSAKIVRQQGESSQQELNLERMEELLGHLRVVERYFSFPGKIKVDRLIDYFSIRDFSSLAYHATSISNILASDSHSLADTQEGDSKELGKNGNDESRSKLKSQHSDYFEVLFVEDMSQSEEQELHEQFEKLRDSSEKFAYKVVVQKSVQDALITLLFNHDIQAVVISYAPVFKSKNITPLIKPFIQNVTRIDLTSVPEINLGPLLGRYIKQFRPELDTYYITDTSLTDLEDSTLQTFRRIYYRREDLQELHLGILRGIRERYNTPFFTALQEYSKKPTGVFHAMPISRGNSVFKSRWIRDFGNFYGRNLFLAETSSTTGGLDSLLQPTGPIKKAQEMAAKAYGAKQTFFVTNGTSTANKIVLEGLVEPGDLVLIDRDCHKSHHYGLVLSGAFPVYLDSYPIQEYSMYGAVPLETIKSKLLQLKRAGQLNKVKMLLLTNCTFDGLVYNVQRVMEEVLAIKPDMIFLWDEAWFAFAGFTYTYRQRTGMYSARKLHRKYQSDRYKEEYASHIRDLNAEEVPSLPDPDKVKIRVYSTQSTHKTLSSFRQGSMIHIWDEDFRKKAHNSFLEAYMTHTSTSANYQILASLDAGRRQVQFEGFEMVEKCVELAMILRAKINDNPLLKKYFDVLTVEDFIPEMYRLSSLFEYYDPETGWNRMEEAWERDEFVLDPTKLTLFIGRTGLDGDTFKNKYLMDQFSIQINKTTRNTVLFMTNIGTTRGSVAYLTNALLQIANQIEEENRSLNSREEEIQKAKIKSLTMDVPPLPDFSRFHASFQAVPGVPGGNIREAYFLAYHEENCEYKSFEECMDILENGGELVSPAFVIPYPPGFPVLVPGQVISKEILRFLLALDINEIHGYRDDLGLRVFKEKILKRQQTATAMSALGAVGVKK